ncbi:MAG: hypothetical protein MN733_39250 [Nitrososphaera sp.]|nr:hypothetical protein [Nitrososphaera sp.]
MVKKVQPKIRHPEIKVKLTGIDGNAFFILGTVNRALVKAGISKSERNLFMAEATAGDYYHMLATCMSWVNVR